MTIGKLRSTHTPDLHNLPDLVLDKILRLLPIKAAVQVTFLSKQWQSLVSSFRTLNFNEHDDFDPHCLGSSVIYQHQHHRFINFLEGYLDFRNKYGRKDQRVDKLSLHMRMYLHQDEEIITKWLKYACQRGLKELDICPDFDSKLDELQIFTVTEHLVESECKILSYFYDYFYRLPLVTIASSAKSLTSLKLGCVQVPELSERVGVLPLFPSLKIMSLKAVRVATDQALCSVLRECPSIEYLSLTYCSIESSKCYVCCSSLKYLEVKFCEVDDIRVDQAFNLESFSFASLRDSGCENMILNNAFNLKYINVSVDKYIREFSLLGCHRTLEATIKSTRIHRFEFFDGYLSAKLSFKAGRDQATIDQTTIDAATVLVKELWEQERLSSDSAYVPRLVSFIKSLSCCNDVSLYNRNVEALTVPMNYRKMTSLPPLPKARTLEVRIPNLSLYRDIDSHEFMETLHWITPPSRKLINAVDVEEERKKVDQRARSWRP